ncbi:MAG: hypothetical protein IT307_15015, partial [Chloroflexi bacterium]|nr:hypothetical protein [Chloroflexota bacterium]
VGPAVAAAVASVVPGAALAVSAVGYAFASLTGFRLQRASRAHAERERETAEDKPAEREARLV